MPNETDAADEVDLDLTMSVVLAGLAIADWVRDAMRERGIDDIRFSQLFVFARLATGPATVRDVAEQMGFSHQAASLLVGELERLGAVRRVPNPADGRSRHIELTERGFELLQVGLDAREELLAHLADQFSEQERDIATRVVTEMLDHVGGAESVRIRDLGFPRTT